MPSFSSKSLERLESCHPDLQRLMKEVVKCYDCTILQGHRSKEDQDEYFRTGKSKVQYPNSKHKPMPSTPVDVVPLPINWNDGNRFYHFAGFVQGVAANMNINIRSGLDWDMDNDLNDQSFLDAPHFEIKE